jgi:SOS response regulatory protein OraA/RecX
MSFSQRPPTLVSTREKLFAYALWYTGKFRVSRANLHNKMTLKTTDPEWIEWVEVQLDPYHDDRSVIRSYFEEVIRLGKSIQPLVSKLKIKGFNPRDITEIRDDFAAKIDEFSGVESRIMQRIRSLEARGQGSRAILIDLIAKYPNFKDQIQTLVTKIDDSQTLADFYTEDFLQVIPGDFKSSKKLVNTLLRKGFDYEDIKSFMKE